MNVPVYPPDTSQLPSLQGHNGQLPASPTLQPTQNDMRSLVDMFMQAISQMSMQMQQQTKMVEQQLEQANNVRERPVEGARMPTFRGKPTECVETFLFQARTYMEGRNIDHRNPNNQMRVVAMLASALQDGAVCSCCW